MEYKNNEFDHIILSRLYTYIDIEAFNIHITLDSKRRVQEEDVLFW